MSAKLLQVHYYMEKYGISELILSSGDKVSLKLGVYKGKLAFIGLAYKDYQVFDEILTALQAKYGKYSNIEQNLYNDPLAGMNKTDINVYWKKQNYILNFCHTSNVDLAHIISANDLVQKEIKSRKSKESLNKIQ